MQPVSRTVALFHDGGWKVESVHEHGVVLRIPPLDISRVPARLSRMLGTVGVVLHEAREPYDRPCAWVEFDLATQVARVHVILRDEWLRK